MNLFPSAFHKPFFRSPWSRIILFIPALLFLLFALNHVRSVIKLQYFRIFDLDKTISWIENEDGIFRRSAWGDLDTILLSGDEWKTFQTAFYLYRPGESGLIFRYVSPDDFHLVLFNEKANVIAILHQQEGQASLIDVAPYEFQESNLCILKVDDRNVRVFTGGDLVLEADLAPPEEDAYHFGLMAQQALSVFSGFRIQGVMADGTPIKAASPPERNRRSNPAFLFHVSVFLLAVVLLTATFLFILGIPWHALRSSLWPMSWTARVLHVLGAIFLFWPFLARGSLLIGSYDNIGEILPLAFYSKQLFLDILQGKSLGLWNPLVHNGVPFFSNHWNMIYYPVNWLLFLVPEKSFLSAMTLKIFLETIFLGWLSYEVFRREFGNRFWALCASLIYQLSSVLIFTYTLYPATALFFAMTWVGYVLWTFSERKPSWSYLLLCVSGYFLLTSANVAFVFYAVLLLIISAVYRMSRPDRKPHEIPLMLAAGLTAGLLSVVRLLPCLWGILNSNRVVDQFATLHSRVFTVVRFFVPQLFGWLGPEAMPVLQNEHLDLADTFAGMNPHNNGFFYFGIFAAVLLLGGLVTPLLRGKAKFWRVFAGLTLIVAFLWQPIWGVLSILFFPLNHLSYTIVLLPLPLCMVMGYAGMRIFDRDNTVAWARNTSAALALAAAYVLVFLVYLFPETVNAARGIILVILAFSAVWMLCCKRYQEYIPLCRQGMMVIVFALYLICLTLVTGILLYHPFAQQSALTRWFFLPWLGVMGAAALAGYIRREYAEKSGPVQKIPFRVYWPLALVTLVGIGMIMTLPYFVRFLRLVRQPAFNYAVESAYGILIFFSLTLLFSFGYVLWRRRLVSSVILGVLFIAFLWADLLVFNQRFKSIAAPFYYPHAFYKSSFRYPELPAQLDERLDLINYRAASQEHIALNANKNIVAGVPSYTGTIGYMPRRFARFAAAFGMPRESILIYPSDAIEDSRFLDLSAVRYIFKEGGGVRSRPSALSRLNIAYAYEVVPDEQVLLDKLSSTGFDHHQTVLVTKDLKLPLAESDPRPISTIAIASQGRDFLRTSFIAERPGLILFNESYDEGWRVFVDGKEAEIIPANYNFMAVAVPAGRHEIEFRYEPHLFRLSLLISGLAFCAMVFTTAILYRSERRRA